MLSLNLAFLKYRNLIQAPNEVFSKISIRETSNEPARPNGFEALVYLNDNLLIHPRENFQLYFNADGGGYHQHSYIAIFKAISEGLERWAYHNTTDPDELALYGFNIDCSTNGMASYPDLFPYKARKHALMEALERWRLYFWWKGLIPCSEIKHPEKNHFSTIELYDPWFKEKTVITYSKNDSFTTYGFATSSNIAHAIQRARVEQLRNDAVLTNYFNASIKVEPDSITEQKLLYFANEGVGPFLEKIKTTQNLKVNIQQPKLIADSEMMGPWSKYTVVWRCLFDHFNHDPNELARDQLPF